MVAAASRAHEPGVVVVHVGGRGYRDTHERATRAELARRLASIKGFDYAGEYDPAARYPGPVYFAPSDTLVGAAAAQELGIATEHDLFGGVVPHGFVATKALTHGLPEPAGLAPEGWSDAFAPLVHDAVLRGFSAFTREDARRAGERLFERGHARVKPVHENGGRGQTVVRDASELDAVLARLEEEHIAADGVVLEENLTEVTTYSVGEVRVADLVASYYGTQRLTSDNVGAQVYGGSDLRVVRGSLDALVALDVPGEVRVAVAQARAYDGAVAALFPGFLASRRNYDVARGRDADGRWRSGVLEQSWRIGGASGAEIAALEAFRADPALRCVRAATVEVYGDADAPPPGATVDFHGIDEHVGPITKYTLVESDGDA